MMASAEFPLSDRLARPLRDLRISVTDRCNFRCTYCMPKQAFGKEHRFLERKALLDFEEITRIARVAVGLGVRKLRLTGGEPLLRRQLELLIAMLSPLGAELTLTTNASLLPGKARALPAAGLARHREPRLVRRPDLPGPERRRLSGRAGARGNRGAVSAGLAPVKVNMVVRRGHNEESIVPLAGTSGAGHVLRFIEYMDVRTTNGWRMEEVVPAAEIISLIGGEQIAGVLGILEENDADTLAVRASAGERVAIPSTLAAEGPGLRDYATVGVQPVAAPRPGQRGRRWGRNPHVRRAVR